MCAVRFVYRIVVFAVSPSLYTYTYIGKCVYERRYMVGAWAAARTLMELIA